MKSSSLPVLLAFTILWASAAAAASQGLLFVDIVRIQCQESQGTGTVLEGKPRAIATVQHVLDSCPPHVPAQVSVWIPKTSTWRNLGALEQCKADSRRRLSWCYLSALESLKPRSLPDSDTCYSFSPLELPDSSTRYKKFAEFQKAIGDVKRLQDHRHPEEIPIIYFTNFLKFWSNGKIDSGAAAEVYSQLKFNPTSFATAVSKHEASLQVTDDSLIAISSPATITAQQKGEYKVACESWYGSSGGALVDKKGRILGIIEGSSSSTGAILNGIAPLGLTLAYSPGDKQ